MRISTAGLHTAALNSINDRNASLLRTQTQIASGKRIQTPADDPSGAVRALELDRTLAESKQFGRNASVAESRLTLEEQTLADAGNLLQQIRGLAVQANSGTLNQTAREPIVTELKVRLQELTDLANRRDASGEYLFSGYSTQTRPFTQSAGGVVYAGDQGVRALQTSPTQRVADSHSGIEVFMNIVEGNGTFVTAAGMANTGSGVIDGGTVTNPAVWDPDTYTVSFTSPTAWEVRDSSNAVVTTGAYTLGGSINFSGVQVNISGQPATGDTFTVAPSATQDMFATVSNLIDTLAGSTITGAEKAQFSTGVGKALTQLDQALDHVSGVRAEVGARLSMLEETQTNREDRELELEKSVSQLRDLDYAEAITRLNLQQLGLEAAQSSYARLAQLSLFDYL